MHSREFSHVLREWSEIFVHRSFRDMKQFMDEAGLSPSQAITLMHLHHSGVSDVTEIAERVGVTSAAASQLIERMVQMGLVVRSESQEDRRYKQVELTEQGQALVKRSCEARYAWMRALMDTLSKQQAQVIKDALKTMTAAAKQLDAELAKKEQE